MGSLSSTATGTGTGFVGQTNQAFVGNRMAGQTSAVTPGPNFTLPGGGADFDPDSFRQGSGQGQSSTRQIRPRYRVSFEFAPTPTTDITNRLDAQIDRLATSRPELAGVQITIDEQGVALLRGEAPDANTRRLIENLVRLEPGIRGVDNQLDLQQ